MIGTPYVIEWTVAGGLGCYAAEFITATPEGPADYYPGTLPPPTDHLALSEELRRLYAKVVAVVQDNGDTVAWRMLLPDKPE